MSTNELYNHPKRVSSTKARERPVTFSRVRREKKAGRARRQERATEPHEEISGSSPAAFRGLPTKKRGNGVIFSGGRRAEGVRGQPRSNGPTRPSLGACQSRRRFIRSDKTELRQRGCGGRERVAKLCYTSPYSQNGYGTGL